MAQHTPHLPAQMRAHTHTPLSRTNTCTYPHASHPLTWDLRPPTQQCVEFEKIHVQACAEFETKTVQSCRRFEKASVAQCKAYEIKCYDECCEYEVCACLLVTKAVRCLLACTHVRASGALGTHTGFPRGVAQEQGKVWQLLLSKRPFFPRSSLRSWRFLFSW